MAQSILKLVLKLMKVKGFSTNKTKSLAVLTAKREDISGTVFDFPLYERLWV